MYLLEVMQLHDKHPWVRHETSVVVSAALLSAVGTSSPISRGAAVHAAVGCKLTCVLF